MTKLHFIYSMKLYYSEPVNPCHFTIKCIPRNNARQKCDNLRIEMDPRANYTYGTDGFGNDKIIGSVREPHDHYYLTVSGDVTISQILYEEASEKNNTAVYKYDYGKTLAGKCIQEFADKLAKEIKERDITYDYNRALFVMHKLHEIFIYDSNATDVNTTAEEAMTLGRGVCQDYAHIFITVARRLGIPARYVTGLMTGEGKSHAWVEIVWKDKWIGIDPTNNLLVDDNYIKLGHGRDAQDCKINLGIMHGGGDQRQEIDVKVWKEKTE